ncbi:uncharacterized protein LODBEIA_P48350 [Lodderomyces beijingensis]|uniref:Autophagy-related protein 6 n=1 Tax=Lodderomyces beijingensis TaxID=1775926 RepID=A0ABP0ZU06_9ASCO
MDSGQQICHECDSSLRIGGTLKRLNPSQLGLIVNTRQNSEFKKADKERLNDLQPSDYLTKEKLSIYNQLPRNAEPMYLKSYFESEDEDDDEDDDDDEEEEDDDEDEGVEVEVEADDDHHNATGSTSNTNSELNSYLVVNEDDVDALKEQADADGEAGAAGGNLKKPDHGDEEHFEIKISSRIKTLNKIFRILSNTQDIDHPLSVDCAHLLLENFKLKFDQSQKEKDQYLSFLKKLKIQDAKLNLYDEHGNVKTQFENQELDDSLQHSLQEFSRLGQLESERLQELRQLESDKSNLEQQLAKNEAELEDITTNQLNAIIRLRNELQLNLMDKQNKLDQLNASYQFQLNRIDELRSSNVYKMMFDINLDEKYGKINSFRLGYKIVWPEINAALGQIVLLVAFILRRLNLKLPSYRVVPMGSQSHIVKFTESENGTKTKKVLNLYSSDEFTLGRLFNFNKLDVAMIALLDILAIIVERLAEIDNELELPYKIRNDTIGGKSIRVTSNSEWTQGCKMLLTNLNWILTFVGVHTHTE